MRLEDALFFQWSDLRIVRKVLRPDALDQAELAVTDGGAAPHWVDLDSQIESLYLIGPMWMVVETRQTVRLHARVQ